MARRLITEEDVQKAVTMYKEGHSIAEIGRTLKWSPETIRRKLKSLGIDTSSHSTSKKYTDDEKELTLKMFYEGKSIQDIAKMVSVNHDTIARFLTSQGINTLSNTIKYDFNRNYFKEIDSEEKAYWLGFILADGSIVENRKGDIVKSMKLEIGLAEKDKDHLVKFCKSVGADLSLIKKRKLKNGLAAYRITLTSTEMCKDLIKHGVNPNKTFDALIPNHILGGQYLRPFLRGLFDGDGFISKSKCDISLTTASLGLLNQVHEIFTNLGCCKGNLRVDERSNACSLRYTNKDDFIKIVDFLYEGSNIHLTRKYERYIAHPVRKLQGV